MRVSTMEIYKFLPKKNCGVCGESSCMSFALKLLTREKNVSQCSHLTEAEKQTLIDLLTPPVREIEIGAGKNKVPVGGEEVMYRHELKFFNPCVLAIAVSDLMDEHEIERRVNFVKSYEVERVGEKLSLDAIAVRCASNDPRKFSSTVKLVADNFSGPLILCSFNPAILKSGAEVVKDRRPLLYAATTENWEELVQIAKSYDAPLAVHAEDLSELGRLADDISARSVTQIVLDPGLNPVGTGLIETLNKFTMLRRSAIKEVKELGYPLMASTAVVWVDSKEKIESAYYESEIGTMLMDRFASLLIIHSTEPWAILPLLTLRQNIYTDPRTEPQVESGFYEFGKPDENSPVLVTTNFSLTFFTVTGDLKKFNLNCYLLVVEAKGFAVDTAVATGDFSASKIKETLEKCKIGEKVKHKKMIIPLLASQIKGAIEEETGWEVLVGTRDSSQIPGFLRKHWS